MSEENQDELYSEYDVVDLVDANDNLESATTKFPYSDMLKKDQNIKYSHENLKEVIALSLKKKFQSKNKTERLKSITNFPTPYIFAKFALKAYDDYRPSQKDIYEQDLPKGWILLTTATNYAKSNCYFGAAYCNLKHQQIVVAHRGTSIKKIGALWTDIKGVFFNYCVSQMNSSFTFADRIIGVLNDLKNDHTNFQLFFTGHSLGGWLAQITSFTSKYRTISEQKSYHAHTVVFDSPGCKDMLIQMQDSFAPRHDETKNLYVDNLDITSYLSAPNRINTCNSHVGTIYRIYVDLPKKAILKNISHISLTHSMKTILEVFDHSTGQVRIDENGMQKIKKVVDWPISHGLLGGSEYKAFFRWATYVNNFDIKLDSKSFQDEIKNKGNRCPIRYQVKNVNWKICSVNVFTQEELLFLQKYENLRELPYNLRPTGLFSDINDQVTEQSINDALQFFKIKNKKIICHNEEELHKLIHYVKNLLHLFPTIKDKVERAFTKDGIKKTIIELKSAQNYNLVCRHLEDFADTDTLDVLYITDDKLSILFVNEDPRIWLARIYKTINKTFNQEKDVILNLKEVLLLVKDLYFRQTMKDFVDDLTSEKSFILFECQLNIQEENEETLKDFFKCLFEKINNQMIKVILIARSCPPSMEGSITLNNNDKLVNLIKLSNQELQIRYITKKLDALTWSNFSDKFKEKLLKKPLILFPGQEKGITLNKLKGDKVCHEFIASIKDPKFLMQLIDNEFVAINSTLPVISDYDESLYIERTFIYQVEIRAEIFKDEKNKHIIWVIIGTAKETLSRLIPKESKIRLYDENDPDKKNPIKFIILDKPLDEKFEKLCQQYPDFKMHMLWMESGRLIWKKSQGAISSLSKYVETGGDYTENYTEAQMLKETTQHKVLIISNSAGMGKSTILTRMSHIAKKQTPELWLFRLDLNDYTKKLKEIKDSNKFNLKDNFNTSEAFQFLSHALFEVTPLKKTLFGYYCQYGTYLSKIIILLDGFDEISPDYKEIVLRIVEVLRESAIKQIWITTRSNMQNDLEDALHQFSFKLKPLSQVDQEKFLIKFWNQTVYIGNEGQDRLQIFAKTLIEKFVNSINDTAHTVIGIPLQTRILAEIFQNECFEFFKSNELKPKLPENLKIFDLYERFFMSKYKIYEEEKSKVDLSKSGNSFNKLYAEFIESYQIMALDAIFNEEMSKKLLSWHYLKHYNLNEPELTSLVSFEQQLKASAEKAQNKIKSSKENISSGKENYGIIDQITEGKSHFIHRTFAEYLVARYFVNCLKQSIMMQFISEFLIKHILIKEEYQVIRIFLNDQLNPKSEFWKSDQNISQNYCIVRQAGRENNTNIGKLMLNSLSKSSLTDTHNEVEREISEQADVWDSQGQNEYNYGLYYQAVNSFLENHKLKLILNQSPHQRTADSFNNLGIAYAKLGQYDQAVEYLKESKKNLLINQEKPHPNVSVSLNNLGSAYWNKRQYDKGIKSYKQSLLIFSKLKIKDKDKLKVMANNLIKLFAKRYYLNTCDIENEIFPNDPMLCRTILHNKDQQVKEEIKECKLLLLFLPENSLDAKLEISTRLAKLTIKKQKEIELWLAIAEGDLKKVEELSDNGIKINCPFFPITTPILLTTDNRDADNIVNRSEAFIPVFDSDTEMLTEEELKRREFEFDSKLNSLFLLIGKPNLSIRNAKDKTPLDCLIEKPDVNIKLNVYEYFCKMLDINIEKDNFYAVPQQLNSVSKKRRTNTNLSIFGDDDHFPYFFLCLK